MSTDRCHWKRKFLKTMQQQPQIIQIILTHRQYISAGFYRFQSFSLFSCGLLKTTWNDTKTMYSCNTIVTFLLKTMSFFLRSKTYSCRRGLICVRFSSHQIWKNYHCSYFVPPNWMLYMIRLKLKIKWLFFESFSVGHWCIHVAAIFRLLQCYQRESLNHCNRGIRE